MNFKTLIISTVANLDFIFYIASLPWLLMQEPGAIKTEVLKCNISFTG